MGPLARTLIVAGLCLTLVGVVLLVGDRFGLGKLPGDFSWKGKNWSVSVPFMSSIVLSILLTLLLNLLWRR